MMTAQVRSLEKLTGEAGLLGSIANHLGNCHSILKCIKVNGTLIMPFPIADADSGFGNYSAFRSPYFAF